MQKMKKLVAFLLVLVMTISLLPATVAMADDAPQANPMPEDVDKNNVHLAKSYDASTQTLTLEAYAKGEEVITVTESTKACDIVLVLDVSGSMSDNIYNFVYTPRTQAFTYSTALKNYGQWYDPAYLYYFDGESYYRVYGSQVPVLFGNDHYRLYYTKNNVRYYLSGQDSIRASSSWLYLDPVDVNGNSIPSVRNNSTQIYNGTLYLRTRTSISKLQSLKNCASDFITAVENNAAETGADHRISIVKFCDDKYYDSSNLLQTGNHSGYSELVRNLTSVTDANVSTLKSDIQNLRADGATAADYGMNIANAVLAQSTDPDRSKVVVLFTDGEPTYGSSFDTSVASNTINYAYNMKHMQGGGTTVWSVGLGNLSTNGENYLNYVSSNYPDAKSMSNTGTKAADGYTMLATDAEELGNIFQKISTTTISGGSFVTLGTNAVVKDVMSPYFQLPEGTTAGQIKLYTSEYNSDESSFNEEWSSNPSGVSASITKDANGNDVVSVTGFDFSTHWCGPNATNGQKLIIQIPIELKAGAAIPEETAPVVETNDGSSGLYDPEGKNVAEFPIPSTEVSTFTIVHCGDTVHKSPVSMEYAVVNGFDFTETVLDGAIYGGTFTDAACLNDPVADGKNTNTAAGETYYLWEVSADHLKPKNLCAYADKPGTDEYFVEAVYLLTAVDRDAYKNVGFIVSDNKTLSGAAQIAVDAANGYADVNSKKIAYEKIQLTQGGKKVGEYTYYQAYGNIAPTTKNSLISCYRLDTINGKPFYEYSFDNETPFYFKAFWTTLDNVLVASSDAREAYYQSADGKSLVVTDHEGYRFWAVHAKEVLNDDSLEEATGSAPLKMMASYSYDQEDSADTVAVPMRMLLAAPKPVVEEPEEPIDDPVVPETSEYINVIDNGESYQARIIAGTVNLKPAGAGGKIFAGWYADEAYTKAVNLAAVQDGETVYAKYISDDYLSVKYTAGILTKKLTLISAIDCRDYARTGFIVEVDGEKSFVPISSYTNSYLLSSARSLFGSSIAKNASIMTCELSLAGSSKNTIVKVTPFAIAKDGTEIVGQTRVLTYTGFSFKG